MLPLHPDVFHKLRQAVLQDIGPDNESEELDFAKLKSCKYMQYVINETLRVFPPVPANSRVASKDTILPTGGGPNGKSPIAIRKGTPVLFVVYAMHRRTDLWGEDAMEFKVSDRPGSDSSTETNASHSLSAGSDVRMTGPTYHSTEALASV